VTSESRAPQQADPCLCGPTGPSATQHHEAGVRVSDRAITLVMPPLKHYMGEELGAVC
jgi:hypothetical protein